jgi:predicted RNase H-like HicB family nuclease
LRYDDAMSEYTAIVKQSDDHWIGWIEEVPGVNCQEATREELVETLRATLAEALCGSPERSDRYEVRISNLTDVRCAQRE